MVGTGGFYAPGPFDAFSFSVFVNKPVNDLVLSLAPIPGNDEAILIFGVEDVEGVPPTTIAIPLLEGLNDQDKDGNGKAVLIINAIAAGNQDPVVSQAITKTFTEDQNTQTVDLLEFSSDPDSDPLTVTGFSVTGDPSSAVTRNGNIVSVNTGAYGALNDGQSQVINLAYTLSDGKGGTVPQTAVITITGITDSIPNQAPVVSQAITKTFTEDQNTQTVDLLEFSSDPDSDPLTVTGFSVTGDPSSAVTRNGNIVSVNTGAYGALNNGQSQVINLAYTLSDGKGGTVPQTAVITITGITDPIPNQNPVVSQAITKTFTEDQNTQTVDLLEFSSDPDSDPLTVTGFSVTGDPSSAVTRNGNIVSVNTGAYGALNNGQSQVINLAYTLSDGKGGTVPQTAVITITGITDTIPNQAPVVSQAITKTFTEDQNTQTVDLLEFSSDPDSDPLTVTGFSVTGDPSSAVTRNGNIVSVNTGAYGALNNGQSQVINLAYTLSDGKGGTVPQTAVITITGITDTNSKSSPGGQPGDHQDVHRRPEHANG